MRKVSTTSMAAIVAATLATTATLFAGTTVSVPIVCSKGPANQTFSTTLTLPASAAQGSTYAVRIDGAPSGKISHTGLNYIYDMATDFLVPSGATFVAGSARVIPGTGTANVAGGAIVSQDAGGVHLRLPGHVDSGSNYTPPSIEFKLTASAAPGTALALSFSQYRVTANAFLVGDVKTTCNPTPNPFPLGTTTVTAAAP